MGSSGSSGPKPARCERCIRRAGLTDGGQHDDPGQLRQLLSRPVGHHFVDAGAVLPAGRRGPSVKGGGYIELCRHPGQQRAWYLHCMGTSAPKTGAKTAAIQSTPVQDRPPLADHVLQAQAGRRRRGSEVWRRRCPKPTCNCISRRAHDVPQCFPCPADPSLPTWTAKHTMTPAGSKAGKDTGVQYLLARMLCTETAGSAAPTGRQQQHAAFRALRATKRRMAAGAPSPAAPGPLTKEHSGHKPGERGKGGQISSWQD